ncbi:MFS transporter [Butyrivibrio sp. WCD3002]|uniref:MFS transporter n=1 Tax=Butyrivibrio sp. WCD3002 TaxID=1280676 RepID=UPI00041A225F|nr:MFS transporter [Butyrivibrio sp. WCD3002]
MAGLLIFIIYLSFISLGLPDSLLGSTWPSMYADLGSTITGAGTLAMLISGCTIVSSLMADKVIHKFGTAKVTAFSVAMTAAALFGFSTCTSYLQMAIWCIPYGLGAGAVDSALNNYVALHYSSRHMSWLHCMWGVGASIGPWIMSLCLTNGLRWPSGYRTISLLQVILTVILVFSVPLWKTESNAESDEKSRNVLSLRQAIALPGAKTILVAFFCYCALEMATGLWAPSWLVTEKGISATDAAGLGALFYLGITVGRAISGFISNKLGDQNMIRLGEFIIVAGVAILMFSGNLTLSKCALVLIGLGCAPVYPSIIHSTPARFGKENSQSLVGIQMAAAYVGSTFAPKIFGLISDYIGMFMYPFYLCFFVVLMILMTERGSKHIS